MFKKIILILALICMIVLPVFSQTGNYTTNKYFYLPEYGAYGMDEYNEYNLYMQKADTQIEANKGTFGSYYLKTEIDTLSEVETIYTKDITDSDELASALTLYYSKTAIDTIGEVEAIWVKDITDSEELAVALTDYYLKSAIDTQGEVETIWEVTLVTDTELAALKFTDLDDTPAAYDNGKYAKSTVDGVVWDDPAGAGDMLKATYDTDEDGDIDVAAGGTEKSSWTQYCIPYLSGTAAFGEIPIGTDNYALTVNGVTGYDWTEFQTPLTFGIADTNKVQINSATVADDDYAKFTATGLEGRSYAEMKTDLSFMTDLVDDTEPELGGEMDSGAHTIGFTLQSTTGDGTTTIDWKLGNKFKFTFGAQNETFTFTAPTNPCTLMLTIIQDGTGSRTVTWPATVKWSGGTVPTLTTTANARDKVALDWDGTQYDGVVSKDFK